MSRARLLALLVTITLVAAACGDDGTDAATATGTGAEGSTATAADGETGDDEPGGAAFPRTVVHDMGETEIPARPERIVVLDTGELDSVTAFGITPVGAVRAPVESGLLDYLAAGTEGTELVGSIAEVNLEAVAALRPDLILSSTLRHESLYDELSQIAPTVFSETVGVVWKDNVLLHAEALGFEDEAAARLADYERRATELGAVIEAERGERPAVSVVRFLPGSTRLYQKASFIGTILDDVGVPRPPAQDVDEFAAEISAEEVELAAGDVIFTSHYGPVDDTTRGELTSSALWSTLDAVQSGDVHEVPDDHWMLGIGIQAAELVLADLERILVG